MNSHGNISEKKKWKYNNENNHNLLSHFQMSMSHSGQFIAYVVIIDLFLYDLF